MKEYFPIFSHQPDLIYFDNASTTQKPHSVINATTLFQEQQNANVHRGIYHLSAKATDAYEMTRAKTASFLNAPSEKNIAFTSGTTESINTVAFGFLEQNLKAEDNLVVTTMEHHANLIPWQILAKKTGAALRVVALKEDGSLNLEDYQNKLDSHTKLVAMTHISNTLGTINPIKECIDLAHKNGTPILIDGAQSAALHSIDVQELNCDFFVFSAHKAFGPFGVGILYVSDQYRDKMTPYKFGGGIVRSVTFEDTTFMEFPYTAEAGTPNVSGVVSWGIVLDFLNDLDRIAAKKHVQYLGSYCREQMDLIDGMELLPCSQNSSGIVSFNVENIHPHDVATFLAEYKIAVRAGHHCTQPLLESLGVLASVRASFSIYNTREEIDFLMVKLKEIRGIFA